MELGWLQERTHLHGASLDDGASPLILGERNVPARRRRTWAGESFQRSCGLLSVDALRRDDFQLYWSKGFEDGLGEFVEEAGDLPGMKKALLVIRDADAGVIAVHFSRL
ncbi:hypothetical protein [Deinococcus hopiensis]|uniref:hypothetical protein n=1 Tax=Deinococcus hopiensis TaxID=309885 RepID=UPI001482F396|nr:hypothetical protein [Deinococcus hopiensis]